MELGLNLILLEGLLKVIGRMIKSMEMDFIRGKMLKSGIMVYFYDFIYLFILKKHFYRKLYILIQGFFSIILIKFINNSERKISKQAYLENSFPKKLNPFDDISEIMTFEYKPKANRNFKSNAKLEPEKSEANSNMQPNNFYPNVFDIESNFYL